MKYVCIIVLGAALMQYILLPLYIWLKREKNNHALKIIIKGCVTFVSVAFCTAGIIKLVSDGNNNLMNISTSTGFETNIVLLIGLVICMVADMVLSVNFLIGMIFFLLGHLSYIIYFITLAPVNPISIIIFLILVFIAARIFRKYKRNMGKMMPAFYVYGSFILITFAISVVLPFSIGEYGVLPAMAAIMLVISDYMLAINTILNKKIVSDLIYLGFYFGGQFIFGLSVFIPAFIAV